MNIGRPLSKEAQQLARERIARDGLEPAAKALRISPYLLAKGACGACVMELSADALETRLAAPRQEKAA
jgi:hypothetical protein